MIIGRKVVLKEELSSTNDEAKRMALAGEEEGTVVVAKRQTAGKGRMGRSWSSPEGGIYLSIILRPNMTPGEMLRMNVLFGIPVAQAISETTGMEAMLKWPNDVIVAGRKIAGLLTESVSQGGQITHLVLGIGVNLNSAMNELEGERPGSLSYLGGREYGSEAFLHKLLFHLDDFYTKYSKGEVGIDEYVRLSGTIDRHVVGSVGDQRISGKAMYVDETGALIIKGDDGLTYRLDSVYTLRYDET
ncbi:MAG: putative biotin ligase [Methanomassiliicoccales archaeon PtaU1.Bin124]|nr:MAG: putative biotin ligase [Methanomassiliicoccales archaeon PtaU1.Bin124]